MELFSFSLRLNDFINKESYVNLQNTFLSKDYYAGKDFNELSSPQDNITINSISILTSDEGQDLDVIEIDFIKDFLEIEIPQIANYYLRDFQKEIEKKDTAEAKSNLAKKYLGVFNIWDKKINDSDYLDFKIKELLKLEIEKTIDSIESYLINPYPNFRTKIPFNLIRTELEYLFFALRSKKIIRPDISDADLGRIIDNMCECQDKEYKENEPKKYVSIHLSRKHLNDFQNLGGRPQEPSIKSLKKKLESLFDNL